MKSKVDSIYEMFIETNPRSYIDIQLEENPIARRDLAKYLIKNVINFYVNNSKLEKE